MQTKNITKMKKLIILASCLLMSISTFAQIKELKTYVGAGVGAPEAFSATISRGIMYNDSYFVGFGLSVGTGASSDYVPALFAHGRMNFALDSWRVTPFVDCKMGMYANIAQSYGMEGFFMRPAVGVTFNRISISAASTCMSNSRLRDESPDFSIMVEYCF
jgi:hypothetical protein